MTAMVELRIEGSYRACEIVGRLRQAKQAQMVTKLVLCEVEFDETLVDAMVDLFDPKDGRTWEIIRFDRCSGPINHVIPAISKSKVNAFHFFDKYSNNVGDGICSSTGADGFFDFISNPSLLTVFLANIKLSGKNTFPLAERLARNNTLQSIDLLDSELDEDAVTILATGLNGNTHLQSIHLSDCRLPDLHVATLVRALESNHSLQSLYLDGNFCRSAGMTAIADVLTSQGQRCQLKDLDISNQLDGDERDDDEEVELWALLPALHAHKSLKSLSTRENNVGDKTLKGLVDVFSNNPTLEFVDLRYNNISSDGIKNIFAANLVNMKGLVQILLRQGRGVLHEDVRDALIRGLAVNSHLEFIDLFQWATPIEYYCDLNRGGRRLLKEWHTPRALWPVLLERAQNTVDANTGLNSGTRRMRLDAIRKANVCYYLLRHGPLLMER